MPSQRTRLAALVLTFATAASSASPATAAAVQPGLRHDRPVEVTVVEDDGFRWTDAGIGALAAVGVTSVAVGARIALRRGATGARDRTGGDTT
jgi:hypothetical protein